MTTEEGQVEEQQSAVVEAAGQSLQLSTIAEDIDPKGVTIDGEFYAYADRRRWSLRQRATYGKYWGKMNELENLEEPTEEDDVAYKRYSADLCKLIIPDCDREVIEALDVEARGQLVLDFFTQTSEMNQLQQAIARTGVLKT